MEPLFPSDLLLSGRTMMNPSSTTGSRRRPRSPPSLLFGSNDRSNEDRVANDETTRQQLLSSTNTFHRVSLDKAVAPFLQTPIAPFVVSRPLQGRNNMTKEQRLVSCLDRVPTKTSSSTVSSAKTIKKALKLERKRALLNASFYSECFLNAIAPIDADTAALEAQRRYEKWWVQSKKLPNEEEDEDETAVVSSPRKRLKVAHHRDTSPPTATTTQVTAASKLYPVTSEDEAPGPKPQAQQQQQQQQQQEDVSVISLERSLSLGNHRTALVLATKRAMIGLLKANGGDTSDRQCQSLLKTLQTQYKAQNVDARWLLSHNNTPLTTTTTSSSVLPMDGTWLTLSKPTFSECLGRNAKGQYMYTLGRLSFDMFRPTNLKCSIQGTFNTIQLLNQDEEDETTAKSDEMSSNYRTRKRPQSFPSKLQKGYDKNVGIPPVRKYDIVSAFTIEPHQTRRGTSLDQNSAASAAADEYVVKRPLRGLLTNHGYCVPDPHVPNRLSIWFSGGSLEVQDETDEETLSEWQSLFDESKVPRRDLKEFARVLAAKFLLGASMSEVMDEDGTLSYRLNRPIGGHGEVYCDVLYSDEDFRIVQGHHGSIFVFSRVPTVSDT